MTRGKDKNKIEEWGKLTARRVYTEVPPVSLFLAYDSLFPLQQVDKNHVVAMLYIIFDRVGSCAE